MSVVLNFLIATINTHSKTTNKMITLIGSEISEVEVLENALSPVLKPIP